MRAVPSINLRPGDKVEMELEDGGLVLRRKSRRAAKLKQGKFGRPVLVAAEGTPPMTTEAVTALIEKLP
jgi:hypothetical protein